jgi:serine O-acetyltransferase
MGQDNIVSASLPEWGREAPRRWWDPSRRLLKSLRRYQAARGPFAGLTRRWWVLQHRFWSVVSGADIPLNSQIGGGLMLPHPNGVVVHPHSPIGPNCLFFQQVTITGGVEIGGHVDIGAGAKILGPVRIGDHAKIGANAVVQTDIPAGATAVGVPARIIKAPGT